MTVDDSLLRRILLKGKWWEGVKIWKDTGVGWLGIVEARVTIQQSLSVGATGVEAFWL